MNIHMISSNKRDADIQLKAMKQAILDMLMHCKDNDIELSASTMGYMHNEIELINEMLGV